MLALLVQTVNLTTTIQGTVNVLKGLSGIQLHVSFVNQVSSGMEMLVFLVGLDKSTIQQQELAIVRLVRYGMDFHAGSAILELIAVAYLDRFGMDLHVSRALKDSFGTFQDRVAPVQVEVTGMECLVCLSQLNVQADSFLIRILDDVNAQSVQVGTVFHVLVIFNVQAVNSLIKA